MDGSVSLSIPMIPGTGQNHHLSIGPAGTGTLGSKWPGRGAVGPAARMAATVSSKRRALARLIRRW